MAENKPIVVYGNIADPLLALCEEARRGDPIAAIQARIDRLLEISSPTREALSNLSDEDFIRSAAIVDETRKGLLEFESFLKSHDPYIIKQVLQDLEPHLKIAQPIISSKESEIDWTSPRVLNLLIGQVRTEVSEQNRNDIFARQYSDENTTFTYQNLIRFSFEEATIYHNVEYPNGAPLLTLGKPVAAVERPPLPAEISSIVDDVKKGHAAGMAETEGRATLHPLTPVSGNTATQRSLVTQ